MTYPEARPDPGAGTARIRMRGPADLIEAVPYLMGFHPEESLVVLGFRGRRPAEQPAQVAFTARIDLDLAEPSGLDPVAAGQLLSMLADSGCAAVVAVVFTESGGHAPAQNPRLRPVWAGMSAELVELGIELLDFLLVGGERVYSVACSDRRCCPAEGRPRSRDSTVAAELTYAGLVAAPDRASLMASLEGESTTARSARRPLLVRAEERLDRLQSERGAEALRRSEISALLQAGYDCEHGARLSSRRLARLGAALRRIDVRDAIWISLDQREITASQLLRQLAAGLPAPYDAAPMFLAGWTYWRQGQGTLAAAAVTKVLESDPDYSAAALLADAIRLALDPHTTPGLDGPWNSHRSGG